MLLPHLLPFLDAEIERLQKARDLLAAPLSPLLHNLELADVEALAAARTPPVEPILLPWLRDSRPRLHSQAPLPTSAQEQRPVMIVKPYDPHRSARAPRRRPAATADTALRGSVPAGPVVISAAAVRQAQADKSAQTATARTEGPLAFQWHSSSGESQKANAGARSIDALLQKLMDIGSEDKALPRPARVHFSAKATGLPPDSVL